MLKSKLSIVSALVASCVLSSIAHAANPGIMVDKNTDCAIYLCLPQGFPGADCQKPLQTFIQRITQHTPSGNRIWTDLPDMKYCIEEIPDDLIAQNQEPSSTVSYRGAYEVSIPQTNICTRWQSRNTGSGHNVTYCAAVQTVPAKKFESDHANHTYETINVGDQQYSTHKADVKHYTEVLVDGVVTGQRYYN